MSDFDNAQTISAAASRIKDAAYKISDSISSFNSNSKNLIKALDGSEENRESLQQSINELVVNMTVNNLLSLYDRKLITENQLYSNPVFSTYMKQFRKPTIERVETNNRLR